MRIVLLIRREEERAGFQKVQVTVHADVENATQDEIDAWLQETEKRCPVTDDIRTATDTSVVMR